MTTHEMSNYVYCVCGGELAYQMPNHRYVCKDSDWARGEETIQHDFPEQIKTMESPPSPPSPKHEMISNTDCKCGGKLYFNIITKLYECDEEDKWGEETIQHDFPEDQPKRYKPMTDEEWKQAIKESTPDQVVELNIHTQYICVCENQLLVREKNEENTCSDCYVKPDHSQPLKMDEKNEDCVCGCPMKMPTLAIRNPIGTPSPDHVLLTNYQNEEWIQDQFSELRDLDDDDLYKKSNSTSIGNVIFLLNNANLKPDQKEWCQKYLENYMAYRKRRDRYNIITKFAVNTCIVVGGLFAANYVTRRFFGFTWFGRPLSTA